MTRSLAATAMAVATLVGSTPWAFPGVAFAEMAGSAVPGSSQLAADSKSKASAAASASSSASSSAGSSSGKPGCQATAESTAEAAAGDKRAYDSDRQSVEDAGDGCSATARSSAKASTGDKPEPPKAD